MGNFITDIGLDKNFTKPVKFGKEAPYLQDIKNISAPTINTGEQPEFKKWGLRDQEEMDLMTYVKDNGGSADDFTFFLEDFRGKRQTIEEEVLPEEEISGLDIGVETGRAISEFGEGFKFQSNVDDGIIESGAKFLANLPGNTAQIAGGLIEIASDPVGLHKSLQTLSDSLVQTGLNKLLGTDVIISEEATLVADSISKEFGRIADEPGRIKELLVENPADVLLTLMGGVGIAKNIAKTKGLTGLVSKLEKAEGLLNPIRIQTEAVKGVVTGGKKLKSSLFPEKSLDDIVLEITQGAEKNVSAAKNALSKIDTTQTKTFKDLNKSIGDKITEISTKQDELLPKEEILKIDDLTTTLGKRKTNFINEALDDLENVGNAENDLQLLNKVDDIRGKENISVKDINDLARFYGSEFKSKSFTARGDPKTSISATRFENNRKGLKNKSRELLPDDVVKTLDTELSNLFETKNLTQKMAEGVVKLHNKIDKRGLLTGVANKIIKGIDFVALGSLKGAFSGLLGSNVGNKTLNILDLQGKLSSNLKKIQKLTKDADRLSKKSLETQAINIFNEVIGSNALKIEGASKIKSNK